jgi:hypothetical protein
MLLVSTGEVCCEPRTELFPGVDRSRGKVHEPSPGRPRQGNMEVCCHRGGVSTCCRDGGDVNLQEFRWIGCTIVLLRQVWPELGWPRHRAEMIREHGAAHASQRGTRQDPSARRGLRCNRSKVVVEVAPLMFYRRSHTFYRETRASTPARLRLSSTRRSSGPSREVGASSSARWRLSSACKSLVGVARIEGKRIDADASC